MLDPGADQFKHAPYNEIVCIKNNQMKFKNLRPEKYSEQDRTLYT